MQKRRGKSIRPYEAGNGVEKNERMHAEGNDKNTYRYYRMLAELSEDLIFIFDADGTIRYLNNHAARMIGAEPAKAVGMNMRDIFSRTGHKQRIDAFRKIMSTNRPVVFEERLRVSGSRKWLHTKLVPASTDDGMIEHIIEISRDIEEKKKDEIKLKILNKNLKEANIELKKLAFRDAHTGLYNLHNLKEVVGKEFQRTLRQGKPFSIIMMDIDYFKSVNDVFGHMFGDTVLKQLARLIEDTVRKYDIVFRYGGEEFTVIAPGADRVAGMMLAERLLTAVNSARFGDSDHRISLKMSLGVSSYPEDEVAEGMDLVRMADRILKSVKEYGGNRACSTGDIDADELHDERIDTGNAHTVKQKIKRLSNRVNHALIKEIVSFADKSQQKISCFSGHTDKVRSLALAVAQCMGLDDGRRNRLRKGAYVYDIGKTGIRSDMLEKPGKWEACEIDEFKAHVHIGADIVSMASCLEDTLSIVKHHHERWDGSGYPEGLAGKEIPVEARIISACDAYIAMVSRRPYREGFTSGKAISIIVKEAGSKYDPDVVGALASSVKKAGVTGPAHNDDVSACIV